MKTLFVCLLCFVTCVGCDQNTKGNNVALARYEKGGALWTAFFKANDFNSKNIKLDEVEKFTSETAVAVGSTHPFVLKQRFLVEGTRADLYTEAGDTHQAEIHALIAFDALQLLDPQSREINNAKLPSDRVKLVLKWVREENEFTADIVKNKPNATIDKDQTDR